MTFVVAEIGINWDGDLKLAREMISKSKQLGCDAVKFQAFDLEIVKNHLEKERLLRSSISQENIQKIANFAKDEKIEWFCSPMYEGAVDMLEPFVKRYKIREFDSRELLKNYNSKIFKKVLETKKEIIISANKSPKNNKLYNNKNIKWLYCVPKYPTKITDLDFSKINEFQGYSNHSNEILVPVVAASLGSEIIEVHITSDKNKDFIDNNVSFDYKELKELMRQIRIVQRIKK